jgi:3-hydroxymyristoyl/3-hydroxydecanoyl-(acyl carrier protein) dehydratase
MIVSGGILINVIPARYPSVLVDGIKSLYYEKKIKTIPSISYMHSRIKSKYVYVYLYIYVQ